MNPLVQLKTAALLLLVALVCFGLLPKAQAVSPAPDGGYPGQNTAEGDDALLNLTTGVNNTAVGWSSLKSNTTTSDSTAIGAGALFANRGDGNTATGAAALFSNTTGAENTADGAIALYHSNGGGNTAVGYEALFTNTGGGGNTAIGDVALFNNTTGSSNTANGGDALLHNMSGSNNTADGVNALDNVTTGNSNVGLGFGAGENVTTASNVICIGASVPGSNTSNACFIGNIFGKTSSGGAAVLVNSDGKLGTVPSSRRFKDDIRPMDKASEAILELKPVTFRYKKELDPEGVPQFGLVAEEVEKVNPDLVIRDKEEKTYSVRYDQVNAMLLNEFLKEHKKVEEQQATIAELKSTVVQQQKGFESKLTKQGKQIEALTAGLQKVSAQLELSKAAPQTVKNTD